MATRKRGALLSETREGKRQLGVRAARPDKPLWSETAAGKRKLAALASFLPPGFAALFVARPAGRYAGLEIKCPTCGARAPDDYRYASRKWRWLAVHQAKAHPAPKEG